VPKITVIDSEDASLWFYPESHIVHHKMHRFLAPGAFQELLTRGVECLEQHQATKWLSDDRDNTVVRPEDIEWGHKVWFPRAVRAGFKYWAIVMPAKAIGQMQMKKLMEEYGQHGVSVKVFASVADGMRWLESVDVQARLSSR
jgi:hypothetical protein